MISGALDFLAMVFMSNVDFALIAIACFTIPALGYAGVVFTYSHQRNDFRELLSIGALRELPALKLYTDLLNDDAKGANGGRFGSVFLLSSSIDRVVHGHIARHSPAECLAALLVMAASFAVIGGFVWLPVDKATLTASAYALDPFPAHGPRMPNIDAKAFTDGMTAIFWAYVGAYVYAFQSLSFRVISRDVTPGHFYALSVRLVISCFVALMFQSALGLPDAPQGTFGIVDSNLAPAVFFFCGVFPQRFLDALQKLIASRIPIEAPENPAPGLGQITGLTEVHIERMAEIGIDSTHALAMADPIRNFVRLPYRLSQLIDWTSQAMVYWAFGGEGARKLRELGAGNIFEARRVAAEPAGLAKMAEKLAFAPEVLSAKWAEITAHAAFIRLEEVSKALARNERPPTPTG